MFEARLDQVAGQVGACLDDAIGRLPPSPVTEAMAYAATGGKRLRAFLVIEGARVCGVGEKVSIFAAAAVEVMHAYSLVHDDLPAMDDDDLRRGRPTVHVRWDDATAILTGDALQALAFELIATMPATAEARIALTAGLARAAGGAGMVRGQALDIAAETADPAYDLDLVGETQTLKTGALIEWSATAGPVLAGADPAPLAAYARALGRAFQIADDILDVEGQPELTGKRVGKDAAAGKATFVSLLGLEPARRMAADEIARAEAALAPYGDAAECLRQAARFVISRRS